MSVLTLPNRRNQELFRFQFTSAGAKTLAVTESGSGIAFIDKSGMQATSYSQTVAVGDYVAVVASNPSGITVIDWNSKTLKGILRLVPFSRLVSITTFRCENNQLTGSIPSLSANPALTLFYCHTNQLTGPIPSLSANKELIIFRCYINQLTGSIPSLSANPALSLFYCHMNQLTGSIPSLSVNTALTVFSCSNNLLTSWEGGTIPATLGDFQAQINQLPVATVNALLAAFVAANKTTGTRNLNLGGTGNAAPTGQGITDKATLVSRGWTVVTN